MGQSCALRVKRWAAIRVGESEEVFGDAVAEDVLPAGVRRRMGRLERLATRCTLGLLEAGTTAEIIFCSRYGNIATLASLLGSITAGELMSPMAFSGSVHNAAPGLIGQIRKEPIPHTALAGGLHTFEAGLIEAYTRLAVEGAADVIVTFADLVLPEPYDAFEVERQPGLALALRLDLGMSQDLEGYRVPPGRHGALEVVQRLKLGESVLMPGGGSWIAQP
jgi:hypothetical protein